MLDTLIVCPGRHGDILACLPIARHLHQKGQRVGWVVTPEYAPTLEGASYIEPVIWDGWFMDGQRAANELGHMARRTLNLRVPGRQPVKPLTDSFAREMWAVAGLAGRWDDLPLVLDRRNPERERATRGRFLPRGGPLLLLALDGHSSPFPHAQAVRAWAGATWPGTVLDLATVKAERLYDLCGLMERADLLIASDSAPLHLSYAVGVPTIGLQTDHPTPWHGTPRRKHWIEAVRYSQVPRWLESRPALPRPVPVAHL